MIMEEFHLTQVEMGRIFGAFLLGYALAQVPAGWLSDYLGPRRLLLIAAACWFGLTALSVVSASLNVQAIGFSFALFLSLRFLLGIAASPAYPAAAKGVSVWIPTAFQGRANGIILMSIGLGSAITPPLVSYLMVDWGWRLAVVVSALPAAVIATAWAFKSNPSVVQEKPEMQEVIESPTRTSLCSREFILLTISYTLQGYVGYIFVSWFYLYLVQERHFSLLTGAWVSSMPWVLSMVSIPLGGVVADYLLKHTRRSYLFPLSALSLSGIFIAIGAHTDNAWVAAATLALATALVLCVEGPFWTAAIQLSPQTSGRAGGIMNAGSNVGGLLSPVLTPLIASVVGWENALLLAAILAVGAGLLWMGIKGKR